MPFPSPTLFPASDLFPSEGDLMATLSRQVLANAGTTVTFTAAGASGDKTVPGDGVTLLVNNGSGASINVILATPATVDGDLAVADRTVAVPAGAIKAIPLPAKLYADRADGGLASWTYSAWASVTVAVIA